RMVATSESINANARWLKPFQVHRLLAEIEEIVFKIQGVFVARADGNVKGYDDVRFYRHFQAAENGRLLAVEDVWLPDNLMLPHRLAPIPIRRTSPAEGFRIPNLQ